MAQNTMRFLALLCTALALAPAMAHLLELSNKIGLSRDDYFTVHGKLGTPSYAMGIFACRQHPAEFKCAHRLDSIYTRARRMTVALSQG
jgi:hypothetical protein